MFFEKTRLFGKTAEAVEIPELSRLQRISYERLLQAQLSPVERKDVGLEALLKEIFPIVSYDENLKLEYLSYELGKPRYTPDECRHLRLTYGVPFRIRCRLSRKDKGELMEDSVYLGEIPLMIGGGEFIINGAERVIVNQLHRSPGVDFVIESQESDRPLHGCRIIPERGSWIEISVSKKEIIVVRIDQSAKLSATTFLRAMDERFSSTEAIVREFYPTQKIAVDNLKPDMWTVGPIVDKETGEVLVKAACQIGEALTQIQQSIVTNSVNADCDKVGFIKRDLSGFIKELKLTPESKQQQKRCGFMESTKFNKEPCYKWLRRVYIEGVPELKKVFPGFELKWVRTDEKKFLTSKELNYLEKKLIELHKPRFNKQPKNKKEGKDYETEDTYFDDDKISKLFERCKDIDNEPEWFPCGSLEEMIKFIKNNKEFNSKEQGQGIYFFRPCNGEVKDGYIGLAGEELEEGGKQGLRQRLLYHFQGTYGSKPKPGGTDRNLLDRFIDDCRDLKWEMIEKECKQLERKPDINGKKPYKVEVVEKVADPIIFNSLAEDGTEDHEQALLKIYTRLRPGNPAQQDKAKTLFKEKFYDANRYRLGRVGRFRLNRKFQMKPKPITSIDEFFDRVKIGFVEVDHFDDPGGKDADNLSEFLNLLEGRIILEYPDMEGVPKSKEHLPFFNIENPRIGPGEGKKTEPEEFTSAWEKAVSENAILPQKFSDIVSLKKWHSSSECRTAPKKPGVYLIKLGNKVVYVGQAQNLQNHLWDCHIKGGPKDSVLQKLLQAFFAEGKELIPDSEEMTLQPDDFLNSLKYLVNLRNGEGYIDDIDHLGNRRLRTIDELAIDELRKGFLKLRRSVQERMSIKDMEQLGRIAELVNSKSISSSIDFFFGRGELSQVVDQTNPLSQLTHERRLSALGPGGLNRKRAGFEVRDVHISHYGRICPIETPEGTNIGLISSLSIYSGVDEYGFLVTPYRKIEKGKVTQVVYLRADQELKSVLAPTDALEPDGKRLKKDMVLARVDGDLSQVDSSEVQYVDVASRQTVGVSAALIPFLEHDDANRALMGSNMQRQAVPLLQTEPPRVATGMEKIVAQNSSMVVRARRGGKVTYVDSLRIIVDNADEYVLRKFVGLNERTCLNQKPVVKIGQTIKKDEIIADGAATCQGELALGRNVLVGFMMFDGYNFEDAILFSEKLVKDDVYTSIHIEEYGIEIRETKLGREEFTRDIPNISEKALASLDEGGVVCVGTYVKAGDILVGKVSPKSKSELSPEEKLLYAIFGRAGEDVKNDSLEVPSGQEGIVIDAKRFSRRMYMNDEQRKAHNAAMKQYDKQISHKIAEIFRQMSRQVSEQLKIVVVDPATRQKMGLSDSDEVVLEQIEGFNEIWIKPAAKRKDALEITAPFWNRIRELQEEKQRKLQQMKRGDELPSGVLEMVKVYIATRRRLAVGDKMAGRHGNKGVIARILPEEDMPFLEDGTPLDVLLNPLGVPSRMNVGQILETHLGWAAKILGFQAVSPVFDGAVEEDIHEVMQEANQIVRQRCGKSEVDDQICKLEKKCKELKDQICQSRKVRTNYNKGNVEEGVLPITGKGLVERIEDGLMLDYPGGKTNVKEGFYLLPKWNHEWKGYKDVVDKAETDLKKQKDLVAYWNETNLKYINHPVFGEMKRIIEKDVGVWITDPNSVDIPKSEGIYFLRDKKTKSVTDGYIGSTTKLKQRLSGDHYSKTTASEDSTKTGSALRSHIFVYLKKKTGKEPSGQDIYDYLVNNFEFKFIDLDDYNNRVNEEYTAEKDEYKIEKMITSLELEIANLKSKKPQKLPNEVLEEIQQAGETGQLFVEIPYGGKVTVYDGRTGERFDQEVGVGYIYLMKLHHLVDDKIHARATGPYSLITQQPLGGKARTGGQRFGEMEVWGLEAYGTAYILQELLTVKSDDVEGRTKIYESMVKGLNCLEAGTPVSFDVLCNEIRGLGLNIQLEKKRIS